MHLGIAVLFIGVAASSSFQHASELGALARAVDARRRLHRALRASDGHDHAALRRAHTGSTLSLGAVLDVSKSGRHVATLNPSEGYYASQEASQGSVGSLIGGQPVSHIEHRRRRHARRLERDPAEHRSARAEADRRGRQPDAVPEEALVAIGYLARATCKHPPPAQFHFIVSPLVMWIWLGGLIVLRRRADRDLAGAGHGAPARRSALARARAARAWRASERGRPCDA